MPAASAAHKAWMSQPRRPGGMNAASTPYGLVLAMPAGQAGLQRQGAATVRAGGRSAAPGLQPPALKISDDVRAGSWSLSRGGALSWPDGCGIYQRRLFGVERGIRGLAGRSAGPSRMCCFMIVSSSGRIRPRSAHDHDPRPLYLNLKLRHNGI